MAANLEKVRTLVKSIDRAETLAGAKYGAGLAFAELPGSRLGFFEPTELAVLSAGLGQLIADTLEAAHLDAIAADQREAAAGTLLLAARLSIEIDEQTGTEHPPLSDFIATAQHIAAGTFAAELREAVREMALKAARESQAGSPVGLPAGERLAEAAQLSEMGDAVIRFPVHKSKNNESEVPA